MAENKTKTVPFNNEGIEELPDNKPAVYKIINSQGENIYTRVAKRGRVQNRIKEHLPGGSDKISGGVKVQIQQKTSIAEAENSETRIISRSQPKHNKKSK